MSTESSDVSSLPSNIVRTLPYTAYVGTLSYAVIFNSEPARALLMGLVMNELTNHLAKKLIKVVFGKDTQWVKRPQGAMDSGIYPQQYPTISTTSGMPSGHAQTSWFMCVVLIQYLVKESNFGPIQMAVSSTYILAVATLTSLSRTKYGGVLCVRVKGQARPPHTVEQVVAGGVFGVVFGLIAYGFYKT
mmetsp:Transcript_19063/g.31216  ORF Transcript_19063/g.31216 Transcript_19063/m.31216 type:complete len:189 (-) Transcript_19063:122-688(-)